MKLLQPLRLNNLLVQYSNLTDASRFKKGVTLVFSKDDTAVLDALNASIEKTFNDNAEMFTGKTLSNVTPLVKMRGKDFYSLKVSNSQPIVVMDADKEDLERDAVYLEICNVAIRPQAYNFTNSNGEKFIGISFVLIAIQLMQQQAPVTLLSKGGNINE